MLFSNSQFSLVVQNTYCKTSCKRGVTLCNASIMCCRIAAFVANNTVEPNSTCVETKMPNNFGEKLKSVTVPLSTEVPNQSTEVLTINLQFAKF